MGRYVNDKSFSRMISVPSKTFHISDRCSWGNSVILPNIRVVHGLSRVGFGVTQHPNRTGQVGEVCAPFQSNRWSGRVEFGRVGVKLGEKWWILV